MSGSRIHVCARSPCAAVYPASKYGMFPAPHHVSFLQVHSPDDLSSLKSAPAVAGQVGSTMEQALSAAEPAFLSLPALTHGFESSSSNPAAIEQAPPVWGLPALICEQAVTAGAPPTSADGDCLGMQAGAPVTETVSVEAAPPAFSEPFGDQVFSEEEEMQRPRLRRPQLCRSDRSYG